MILKRFDYPRYDYPGDGDLDAGTLEQLVPQVDPVPEGDDVPLDGDVVFAVKPVCAKRGRI